ncbi:MAG: hypothetical protein CEE41_04355 [Hadesarchaea archaeon B3_Hades]|nr:MAG: hypothetical protein CEE41_04355 [Hadesarchaea archaeon B3_Hades]
MPGQPKFTRTVAVTVEIEEAEVGPVNVARYQVTPGDLTDGDRAPLLADIKGRAIVKIIQDVASELQGELRPRPKGGILEKGAETTTDTYATIASVTVTADKDFQLSKVVVSAEYAAWIKYRWAGADISCERLMDDKTILLEHFPWDYEDMEGDGAKVFDVQAKYYEEEGTVSVEIVGEEV